MSLIIYLFWIFLLGIYPINEILYKYLHSIYSNPVKI